MSNLHQESWAASLPLSAANAVAGLRLESGITAAVDGDTIWLRGVWLDESLNTAISRIAPADLFIATSDGVLTRRHELLPHGRLPNVTWTPIAEFVQIAFPRSRLSGTTDKSVVLTLIPSNEQRPANAILTSLTDFAGWADDAADFRLHRLRYAASGDRVLILGEPVPSIDGVRLYEGNSLCVPCGFELSVPIDSDSARLIFGMSPGDIALIEADRWHLIPADAFQPATRSSVRLTAKRGSR